MRVLFLNQYYYPDIAATAQILTDVCEDLSAAEHQVTVVCGTARYRLPHKGDRVAAEAASGQALPRHEHHHGVDIHRVPTFDPKPAAKAGRGGIRWPRLLRRAVAEASFAASALRSLRRLDKELEPPPEVLVTMSSPPLLLALALVARATARRRPVLVYWVQDVYPELLFALGALRLPRDSRLSQLVERGLCRLWQRLYRDVDGVVALDEEMKRRLVAAGLPPQRIEVIEHFADCRELSPQLPAENRLRKSLGLHDRFVIGYAGNLGRGHDFETVAAALQLLARADAPADAAALHFLFIGDGEKKPPLVAAVPPALRARVHFLPPQARSELRDVLTAGDVGLVTLAAGLEGLMVPSKLYALLAAGRPLVYVGPAAGRVAELCTAAPGSPDFPIGESVRNGDAAGLVAAWLRLLRDPGYRDKLGHRARQLAEARYDRPLVTARHAELLQKLASAGRQRSVPR